MENNDKKLLMISNSNFWLKKINSSRLMMIIRLKSKN